ncbi:glycosyltransferase family 2 protein [Candidatus Peregrinibacteria bacterium]|nr:glycosyltransferase family 2 protein [Candidatus Peregrinibacteria bacterium]
MPKDQFAPLLSIVIPTHRRPEILKLCLEHIENQTVSDSLETIVVSDGPDEETKRMLENYKWKISIQYFEIPKSQQGAARNKGMQRAHGQYILFIGDDIFLAPAAAEKHLRTHSLPTPNFQLPTFAVLGFTAWDPACGITPVMRWLDKSGWQFGYRMLARYAHDFIPADMQRRFTYASHISLPAAIAKKFPFREDAALYGWEDIEWGLRLKNAGVGLLYEPGAKALHHHHITVEDSLKRMETLGKSAVEMEQFAPELKLTPRKWKLLKYRMAAMLPGLCGAHYRAFLRGISIPHGAQ